MFLVEKSATSTSLPGHEVDPRLDDNKYVLKKFSLIIMFLQTTRMLVLCRGRLVLLFSYGTYSVVRASN